MSDSEYKIVDLRRKAPHRPSVAGLAANQSLRGAAAFTAMQAQDSVVGASRRVIARIGLNGAESFRVGSSLDPEGGDGGQVYPDVHAWRLAAEVVASLTPGCFLEARVLYLPAGATNRETQPGSGGYVPAGTHGAVRLSCTWTHATDTAETVHGITFPGSSGVWGAIGDDSGENWPMIREEAIMDVRPSPAFLVDALAEWSTRTRVEIEIEIQGTPRIVDLVIHERPYFHAQAHDDVSPAVHGYDYAAGYPTPKPQTKQADGATYGEQRFGTLQQMRVASRQSAEIGPTLAQWDCHRESEEIVDFAFLEGREPIEITSESFVDIFDAAVGSYDPAGPAMASQGQWSLQHATAEDALILRGRAAVVPVRVWLVATRGATDAPVVRFQTSARSWIDHTVQDVAGWQSSTGYLEVPPHADSADATGLQVFAYTPTDSEPLMLFAFVVEYLQPSP